MKKTCSFSIFCFLVLAFSNSKTVAQSYSYFDPPSFTQGPLTSLPVSVPTDRPFTGQGGWSLSIGDSRGEIQAYGIDGLYNGTQALRAPANEGYIGALNERLNNQLITLAYSQPAWSVQTGFAARISEAGQTTYSRSVAAGFWNDRDADDLFDINEYSFRSGIFSGQANTGNYQSAFGILTATGIYKFSNLSGGVTTNINAALTVPQAGWYSVNTIVRQNVNQSDFDLEMSVQVLSSGGPLNMGQWLDFDINDPGTQPFKVTLSSAELGMDRVINGIPDLLSCLVHRPLGLTAMVEGFDSAIDFEPSSFPWKCACVPEPSSGGMIFACLPIILRRQRNDSVAFR